MGDFWKDMYNTFLCKKTVFPLEWEMGKSQSSLGRWMGSHKATRRSEIMDAQTQTEKTNSFPQKPMLEDLPEEVT